MCMVTRSRLACVLLGGRFASVVELFGTQLEVYAMQLYGQFTGSYAKKDLTLS